MQRCISRTYVIFVCALLKYVSFYLLSMGVRRPSVTWADDSTSLCYGHNETATAPSTIIADVFFNSRRIQPCLLAIRRYVYFLFSVVYQDRCLWADR